MFAAACREENDWKGGNDNTQLAQKLGCRSRDRIDTDVYIDKTKEKRENVAEPLLVISFVSPH